MYRFIVASIIAIIMLIPTFGTITPARAQSVGLCEAIYFDLFDTSCGQLDWFNATNDIFSIGDCKNFFKDVFSGDSLTKSQISSVSNFLCNCTQKLCGFPSPPPAP